MKLEVGMYVRTDLGEIGKVTSVLDDDSKAFGLSGQFYNSEPFLKGTEIKASHNIIDLIEKNDIILGKNGKIYQVWKIYKDYIFTYTKNKYGQTITLVDYQIDKVLTKDQFEINCFSIGTE